MMIQHTRASTIRLSMPAAPPLPEVEPAPVQPPVDDPAPDPFVPPDPDSQPVPLEPDREREYETCTSPSAMRHGT
jgi:hypothetical protein